MPTNCNLCRSSAKYAPPSDSDRRYWLKIFSDVEIVTLATAIWDSPGDVEVVHAWREQLLNEDNSARKAMVTA